MSVSEFLLQLNQILISYLSCGHYLVVCWLIKKYLRHWRNKWGNSVTRNLLCDLTIRHCLLDWPKLLLNVYRDLMNLVIFHQLISVIFQPHEFQTLTRELQFDSDCFPFCLFSILHVIFMWWRNNHEWYFSTTLLVYDQLYFYPLLVILNQNF